MELEVDYALVGGGLQNGLIALALRAHQPTARLALLERGAALGGNHTWCFHAQDVPARARTFIEPLVAHRWPGYHVRFPERTRHLRSDYACIPAARFDEVVRAALVDHHVLCQHEALELTGDAVTARHVATGAQVTVRARAIIDARGPDRGAFEGRAGYQKFVGLELACPNHGLTEPVLMDACVDQTEGYRFFYVLPLDQRRLLIEDTYFADSAYLDVSALRERILAYAAERGFAVAEVVREETGVLPLPWHAELPPPERTQSAALTAGYQGGWFHPATGYSFPVALRLALAVADTVAEELPGPRVAALWRAHAEQLSFSYRLNWMLFRWFAPPQRYHVMEHFYRLPEDTIARFYACELTAFDKARLFLGRPPRGMSWRAALSWPLPDPTASLAKEPR